MMLRNIWLTISLPQAPKFEAGISFIEKGDNRRTIITDIAHAKDGYFEKTGTIIK